jgi:hypothetical protein
MSDGNKATIQKEGKYKGEGQERCIELSTETHAVTAQAYASPQYDSRDMASRGRLGAYALRATHDPREYTSSARKSFLARFMPSDPGLSEQERLARAQAGLKLHMLRLARLSARARAR